MACLQLCSQRLLSLDEPSEIRDHLPELWKQPILDGYTSDGQEILRARTLPLTLRHLLSHTSGLAYSYNSPHLARWIGEHQYPDWFIGDQGVKPLELPLMFEPGTHWRFSLGIDWAGVLISRKTGQTLDQYFQDNIFRPLNLMNMSFHPSDQVKNRLQPICVLDQGELSVDKEAMRPRDWDRLGMNHWSGGAGLFGPAKQYLRFLQALLRSKDGNGIIPASAFAELFDTCLKPRGDGNPQHSELVAHGVSTGVLSPAHCDDPSGQSLDFSLGLLINTRDSEIGRHAGTGCGDSAGRTHFYIDPEAGIVVRLIILWLRCSWR